MKRFLLLLGVVLACAGQTTEPGTKAPTDRASFNAGPNDRGAGSWQCSGTAQQTLNCLKAQSLDPVGQSFVNVQILFIQQVQQGLGPSANTSCDAHGTQLFVDKTSGKLTNGGPGQFCNIDTPQNVQTVIVYPNPYGGGKEQHP